MLCSPFFVMLVLVRCVEHYILSANWQIRLIVWNLGSSMNILRLCALGILLLCFGASCGDGGGLSLPFGDKLPGGGGSDLPDFDEEPPVIRILSDRWAREDGVHELKIEVFDNDRVASVRVLVKSACTHPQCGKSGTQVFRKVYKNPNRYLTIPLTVKDSPNTIYIRAVDRLDNKHNEQGTIEIRGFSDRLRLPEDDPRRELGCAVNRGNISIQSPEDLAELAQVKCRWIVGNVDITGVAGIKNLALLQRFERIEGKLTLRNNPDLESLVGLGKLLHVQDLHIENNHKLPSLLGLNSLETVSNSLIIRRNNLLDDVSAIQNVSKVKNITLSHLNRVQRIDLPKIKHLRVATIGPNQNLSALDMSSLREVNRLKLQNNGNLKSLKGFERLEEVLIFELFYNNLQSLDGLQRLSKVSQLSIHDGTFETFEHLTSCPTINKLVLHSANLTDFSSLPENLTHIEELNTFNLESLGSLAGLDRLEHLGNASFFKATNLRTVRHLPQKGTLRTLNLHDNTGLTNLVGLDGRFSENGELYLNNVENLAGLEAMEGIKKMRTVNIRKCNKLKNLEGLSTITHLQNLQLNGNFNLNDISQMSNLQQVRLRFEFIDNTKLPSCEIQKLQLQLTQQPNNSVIRNNSSADCN